MDQTLLRAFHSVPLKTALGDFVPHDTTPWTELGVDLLLRCDHQRSREEIKAGVPVSHVENSATWIRQNLPPSTYPDLLDIGCGAGLYSHALAEQGYRVTGVDISEEFLSFARSRVPSELSCRYVARSMFDLGICGDFDVALVTQGPSLHLTSSDLQILLSQLRSALRSGGHFLCQFSIAPSEFGSALPTTQETLLPIELPLLGKPLKAYLLRELTFPREGERVNHRLFLYPDGQILQWWTRFPLQERKSLVNTIEQSGFRVIGIFGRTIGQPLTDAQNTCHILAQKLSAP